MTREELIEELQKEFGQLLAPEKEDVIKYIHDLKRRREQC